MTTALYVFAPPRYRAGCRPALGWCLLMAAERPNRGLPAPGGLRVQERGGCYSLIPCLSLQASLSSVNLSHCFCHSTVGLFGNAFSYSRHKSLNLLLIRIPFDHYPFAFMLRQAPHEREPARERPCSAPLEPAEGRAAFALMDSPQSETVLYGFFMRSIHERVGRRRSRGSRSGSAPEWGCSTGGG